MIAQEDTGITVTMTDTPDLESFIVTPLSSVNGEETDYKITVKSPIPHLDGDKVEFTFPSEITLPGSISCSAGTNVADVSC